MQAFGHNEKKIRDYVKKMMGRITFLHFLQRKGWMCGDLNYMQNMFENSSYKYDYLDSVLEPLFFGILNTKPAEREALFTDYGWDKSLLNEWKDIPYLNGGLFERDEEDEPESRFPADYFKHLFQFFSEYNFTIDENDPNDAEVGVDPEMLGKIFENLLEDNKDKGAFYTPKEIVRYMCQESLIAYLETNTSIAKEKIRKFVLSPEDGVADIPENKKQKLLTALEEVKICDPAIGSGAFPMGLLNELLHCREVLSGEHYDRAEIKKSIIQNNIYGVDIEKGAVDIARLRFWLSIVVDEETPSPLPNLDYKIMQGNSLIESFMGVDLSKLTYEKEYKKDKGEISLFDDEKNRLQKTVSHLLSSYYSCSDHDRKVKLQQEISDTINKQLEAQAYDPTILSKLKTTNLAENNKFFLWHTWFSDVFNRDDKEGFDIVIGNPPYVNFANIKSAEYRTILKEKFYSTKNKCDLYAFFIEFGFNILNDSGIITYIVPHTWKATDSFSKLREILFKRHSVKQIVNLDMGVFDAIVQPLIMLADNRYEENSFINIFNSDFTLNSSIITEEILASPAYIIDTTSSSLEKNIFKKIEEGALPLSDFIRFSRGIKTSDDKRFIINEQRNSDCKKVYRGRNLKAYQLNWNGEYIWYRPDLMRQKVGCVPHTKEFFDVPEKLVTQRVNSSRQLLVAYDNQQNYFLDTTNVSNYSTWDGKTPLKYLCGLLNSKLINFWYCKKYLMPTIGGYELHSIPIKTTNDYSTFTALVDEAILAAQQNNYETLRIKMKEIDKIVYDIYELTDAEIKIIEQSI